MSNSSLTTYGVLKSLGFAEDRSVISDPPGGLSFDFGNFKLEASHFLNGQFASVVLLSGVMATPRTTSEVRSEMPQELESEEQGSAWVTWCLDHSAGGRFESATPVPWLDIGRQNRHLLPWVRAQAAYEARLHCSVRRDWARMALRDLAAAVSGLDDDALVDFAFDGELLIVRCNGRPIAMPASGEAWGHRYRLPAASLRRLPNRLMLETVSWSVWDGALSIGNHRYGGLITMSRATS